MEPLRAIRFIGLSLVGFAVLVVLMFLDPIFLDAKSPFYAFAGRREIQPQLYFWAASVAFYLVLGVGVLLRARWAYWLLKGFLYLLLLGFPIGTWISFKLLAYMKRSDLKQYFGTRILTLLLL